MKYIYVTKPLLPNMSSVQHQLDEIWDSKIVTNAGPKHNLLERKLQKEFVPRSVQDNAEQ